MKKWSKAELVYRNPDRLPAESSSMHCYRDRWVIWLNDYSHCADPTGDFHTGYVFSDNPLKFAAKDLQDLQVQNDVAHAVRLVRLGRKTANCR